MGVIDRQAKQQMFPAISSGPDHIMNQGSYSFFWPASPWAAGSNKLLRHNGTGKGGVLNVEAMPPTTQITEMACR